MNTTCKCTPRAACSAAHVLRDADMLRHVELRDELAAARQLGLSATAYRTHLRDGSVLAEILVVDGVTHERAWS